jgi:hypothetical protein
LQSLFSTMSKIAKVPTHFTTESQGNHRYQTKFWNNKVFTS